MEKLYFQEVRLTSLRKLHTEVDLRTLGSAPTTASYAYTSDRGSSGTTTQYTDNTYVPAGSSSKSSRDPYGHQAYIHAGSSAHQRYSSGNTGVYSGSSSGGQYSTASSGGQSARRDYGACDPPGGGPQMGYPPGGGGPSQLGFPHRLSEDSEGGCDCTPSCCRKPSIIDGYSRVLSPLSFIAFNCVYWFAYLNISQNFIKGEDFVYLNP